MIRTEAKPATLAPPPTVTATVLAPFDYGTLSKAHAKLAREAAVFIEERRKATTTAILEIGRKLLDVKATLGHGHFSGWLHAEFGWTDRTARNYMTSAEALGDKSETVSVLPPTTLYALAGAAEPVRAKVVQKMDEARQAAAPLPVETVKELIAEAKADARAEAIEAAHEARKPPELKAREKATKEQAERDRQKKLNKIDPAGEVRRRKNRQLAILIGQLAGEKMPAVIAACHGSDFASLAIWLEDPDGWRKSF